MFCRQNRQDTLCSFVKWLTDPNDDTFTHLSGKRHIRGSYGLQVLSNASKISITCNAFVEFKLVLTTHINENCVFWHLYHVLAAFLSWWTSRKFSLKLHSWLFLYSDCCVSGADAKMPFEKAFKCDGEHTTKKKKQRATISLLHCALMHPLADK